MKRIFLSVLCILLAACMVASLASCAVNVSAEELSAGYVRKADGVPSVGDGFRLSAADFSMDLLREIPMEEGKNVLLSPLSALLCLGMVTGGADGETLAELEAAFGMDSDSLNESLYAYVQSLYSGEGCEVAIANSIWTKAGDSGFSVNEDFLQKNADFYGAQIYRTPFNGQTVKEINAWVNKHTDGMIKEIIDTVSPDTVMMLINALMFDAKWQTEYEKGDIDKYTFTDYKGNESRVDMMNSSESTYLELDGAIGFAKNYEGGKYSFVGLLPEEGQDVYEFACSIDGEDFISMWDGRTYRPVNARIPEFTYENEFSLVETLRALGVEDMFSPEDADFSGLGESANGNIFCSDVRQKTFIEVSRNGTKAAAVTWATMECTSAAPMDVVINVFLDRPFVYAIVDNATGLPLFVGVVANIS